MDLILFSVHGLYMCLFAPFILFINNINSLICVGIIIFLTAMANYEIGDCPMSLIEDKYGGYAFMDFFGKIINKGEDIDPYIRPALSLEVIWIGFILICSKIMCLLVLRECKPLLLRLLKEL